MLITQGLRIYYSFRKISRLPRRLDLNLCLQSLCFGSRERNAEAFAHPAAAPFRCPFAFSLLIIALYLLRSEAYLTEKKCSDQLLDSNDGHLQWNHATLERGSQRLFKLYGSDTDRETHRYHWPRAFFHEWIGRKAGILCSELLMT